MGRTALIAVTGAGFAVAGALAWLVLEPPPDASRVAVEPSAAQGPPPTGEPSQRPAPPAPPAPPDAGTDPLHATATAIRDRLSAGSSPEACWAIRPALHELFVGAGAGSQLLRWAAQIADDCRSALLDYAAGRRYLDGLLAADASDVRLVASQAFIMASRGDVLEAQDLLERALQHGEHPDLLDMVGFAHLSLARSLKGADQESQRTAYLLDAERAFARAVELSEPPLDVLMLERGAQVKLALGKPDEAMSWADRALHEALREDNTSFDPEALAALYQNVGEIYLRAGQRAVGLAYMDQAITMVPPEEQATYREMREAYAAGRI